MGDWGPTPSKKEKIQLLTRQRDLAREEAKEEKEQKIDTFRSLVAALRQRDDALTTLAAKEHLLDEARATIERLEAELAEKGRELAHFESATRLARGRVRELESKPTQVIIQAPCGAEVTVERVHRNFAQGGVI